MINQIEDFIDKLMDEWTLKEMEIKVEPKYGNTTKISKKLNTD